MESKYAELNDASWLKEQYVNKKLGHKIIAKDIGCGRSSVLRALRRHGIETRKNNGSKYKLLNDKEWLYNKYIVEKNSMEIIAGLAGAKTSNSVGQSLDRFNIPKRSNSDGLTCKRETDHFVLNEQLEII